MISWYHKSFHMEWTMARTLQHKITMISISSWLSDRKSSMCETFKIETKGGNQGTELFSIPEKTSTILLYNRRWKKTTTSRKKRKAHTEPNKERQDNMTQVIRKKVENHCLHYKYRETTIRIILSTKGIRSLHRNLQCRWFVNTPHEDETADWRPWYEDNTKPYGWRDSNIHVTQEGSMPPRRIVPFQATRTDR